MAAKKERTVPKAIRSRYKDIEMRSQLETKWAAFFDSLNIKWEYEPERYPLPDGRTYLPDFRISAACGTIVVEVKPVTPTEDEKYKLRAVRHRFEHSFFLIGTPGVFSPMFVAPNGDVGSLGDRMSPEQRTAERALCFDLEMKVVLPLLAVANICHPIVGGQYHSDEIELARCMAAAVTLL